MSHPYVISKLSGCHHAIPSIIQLKKQATLQHCHVPSPLYHPPTALFPPSKVHISSPTCWGWVQLIQQSWLWSSMSSFWRQVVGVFFIEVVLNGNPAAAGAIRSEYSPAGGVQWLPAMPWTFSIVRWAWYCTHACAWPSKWPTKEVPSFFVPAFFVW